MEQNTEKLSDIVNIIIKRLNERANRKFVITGKGHSELIERALAAGHTCEDLIKIIEFKFNQWANAPSMRYYLKPSTLFAKHNLRRYKEESEKYFNPLLGTPNQEEKNKTMSIKSYYSWIT